MPYHRSQYRALIQRLEYLRDHDLECMATSLQGTVARDLAEVTACVATLRRSIAAVPSPPGDALAALEALDAHAARARDAVRQLAYALQPPGTADLGLVPTLERCLAEFAARTGLVTELQAGGPQIVAGRARERVMLRALEECLSNVERHARARSVTVHVDSRATGLVLGVADDGVGLEPGAQYRPGTLGLFALNERVLAFGGQLRLDSARGRGTLVEVTLPPQGADVDSLSADGAHTSLAG